MPGPDANAPEQFLLAVVSGFLLAALAPWVKRVLGPASGWIFALLPAALFVYFAQAWPSVADGQALKVSMAWAPDLGVALAFRLDGLSLTFALLISGIGTFIVLYAGGYLAGAAHQGRFYSFLLMFMSAMLGLVLADDVITLFVFWELTSVTSFLLIGYDHARPAARRAALQALLVTGGGGLALLAGLLLLAQAGGSFLLSDLTVQGAALTAHPLYLPVLVLVCLGCFTKSAQVPFHFWLPNAMEAPTPVSAFLHSATMVKAGVYLLARLAPALGGTPEWMATLTLFGTATFVLGALLAVKQTDLKLMLAQTTVASLGLLVALIGIGSEKALEAMALYLVAHACFKAALFMVAGAVDHGAGTRDATQLGGLARAMPVTAGAALLAALSMAGLPPFVGFIAKEFVYGASGYAPLPEAFAAAALIANALLFVAAGVAGYRIFFGATTPYVAHHHPHEAGPSLLAGPVVLALAGLALGVVYPWTEHWLIAPIASSVAGRPVEVELFLWHGFDVAVALSAATIALGLLLLWQWDRLRAVVAGLARAIGWGPDRGWDQVLSLLFSVSAALTGAMQNGKLTTYLRWTAWAALVALAFPLVVFNVAPPDVAALRLEDVRTIEWALAAMLIVGAAAVVALRERLVAILSLGVVGYTVALVFLLNGAPDLAFTQVMIETLAVIVLAVILLRLPMVREINRKPLRAIHDGAVALGIGAAVAVLFLAILALPFDRRLTTFFEGAALPDAHGRNVVNVIIVDFRALDTLGEIAVVMICAVAAVALIRLRGGWRQG